MKTFMLVSLRRHVPIITMSIQGNNPFSRQYSCELRYPLNFDKMNEAAAYLIGEKDFKVFRVKQGLT